MTLLSLASKQIWPQVLGFLQLQPKPDHLVLFHTTEDIESAGPARRLKSLFASQNLLPELSVELVPVAHDRFGEIVETIATTAERLELDDSNCRLNLTGGNKLMALAAAEWCRLAGVPCFYLERDCRVFPFLPRGTDLLPQEPYQLDPHLARDLEPLELLRCQLGGAKVAGTGQRLVLNERGRRMAIPEVASILARNEDVQEYLQADTTEDHMQPGHGLEFATAFVLLKLGVPVVQRSVRLTPKVLRGSGLEEGELDLVFNWSGKLWVVDCKDRRSAESRINQLRHEIHRQGKPEPRLEELTARLADELRERDLHPLKEDLLAVTEVGGLLGRAICVRRTPLPPQADEFARSRKLTIVLKDRILPDLRIVLFPDQPASLEQLREIASERNRSRR